MSDSDWVREYNYGRLGGVGRGSVGSLGNAEYERSQQTNHYSPPPGRTKPTPRKFWQVTLDKVISYEGDKLLFWRHGHGIGCLKSGGIYEGKWFLGKPRGKGKVTYDSYAIEGRIKSGRFHGPVKLMMDGLRYEGHFRSGYPKGAGQVTDPSNGVVFKGRWSGHGEATGWLIDPEGRKTKAMIVEGDIKIKTGLLKKEIIGQFDTLAIMAGVSVKD